MSADSENSDKLVQQERKDSPEQSDKHEKGKKRPIEEVTGSEEKGSKAQEKEQVKYSPVYRV